MFIKDKNRERALNAITRHISRKSSLLITAPYGAGKTELLKQIKEPSIVRVSSLGGVYQILGGMCRDYSASPWQKDRYLKQLLDQPRPIIIDEAQHLPEKLYPYLKIIMDAGNTIVLAGLPDLRERLAAKHPNVLSRLTDIKLPMLGEDDLYSICTDFEPAAFSVIYGSTNNMRSIFGIVENCRDYAKQEGVERIGFEIVDQFIGE